MNAQPQSAIPRRETLATPVLLLIVVASLAVYKTGPALRAIRAAQSHGELQLRPYLSISANISPGLLWRQSFAYLRTIWPTLAFGILIAAVARMAIPKDWFITKSTISGLRATLSGAAAGTPLMLCSCCAAPLFEGVYGRTRRLDSSLALMLAAPALNPAALTLTFILFPSSVAAGRLALTIAAFAGIAAFTPLLAPPTMEIPKESHSSQQRQAFLVAFLDSVRRIALRTVPLILVGVPMAILLFNQLHRIVSFGPANSAGILVLFMGAMLLLPLPTLFEIPLAYSLMTLGAPLRVVAATLFVGPALNLPSLLVVARAAGPIPSLFMALLVGGLATATALTFHP